MPESKGWGIWQHTRRLWLSTGGSTGPHAQLSAASMLRRTPGDAHGKPHPVSSWITHICPSRGEGIEAVTTQTHPCKEGTMTLAPEWANLFPGRAQLKTVEKEGESLPQDPVGPYLGCSWDHIPFLAMGPGEGSNRVQTHYILGLFVGRTLLCIACHACGGGRR